MKKNTFKINGITYQAREFDFELICDLEEMGVQLAEISDKPTSTIRAYFALCAGEDKKYAAGELQNHLLAGGKLDGISKAMSKAMEESDFFHALSKGEAAEHAADEEEETEETYEEEEIEETEPAVKSTAKKK